MELSHELDPNDLKAAALGTAPTDTHAINALFALRDAAEELLDALDGYVEIGADDDDD